MTFTETSNCNNNCTAIIFCQWFGLQNSNTFSSNQFRYCSIKQTFYCFFSFPLQNSCNAVFVNLMNIWWNTLILSSILINPVLKRYVESVLWFKINYRARRRTGSLIRTLNLRLESSYITRHSVTLPFHIQTNTSTGKCWFYLLNENQINCLLV